MAIWDDIIKTVTGQKNAPARTSSGALSKAAATIKPGIVSGGGGGGGMRPLSVPTPAPDQPAGRVSRPNGGRSFDEPVEPTRNWFEQTFLPKPALNDEEKADFKLEKEKAAAQQSPERDLGDRLPGLWDNSFLEGLARPFIPLDEANENDASALNAVQQSQQSFQDQYTPGEVTFRHLSQEEWDALDVKTQQAITANYALYQATQADKALTPGEREEGYDDMVGSIFGTDGGSDTYAPNTVRVLTELGYTNVQNDLDNFLNGGAILSESDLLEGKANDARAQLLQDFQGASAWQNSNLVPMLEQGTSLIDSLRQGDALSADTLRLAGIQPLALYDIDPERMDALNGLMQGMASRDLWAAFESDPEASSSFKADFDSITNGLDPALVSRYFRESYPQYFQNAAFGDSNAYMTPDEFYATWLTS
ncbi:hypothetical protein SEA_DUMPQUIST_41 [Microbacterium phage DumpQuist]|nr:hypothetical protein SEA_DUMPQUIST_41 [Microbacterium phage DumpQuist]